MLWLKPFWTTANYIGEDQGRYIFSFYKNDGDKTYSINFAVFEKKGTTVHIRMTNEYVTTLSVDTNANEHKRWYKDGPEKWTHLVMSWDASKGSIKIYINGELQGERTIDKWIPYTVGDNSWLIIGNANKGVFTEFWGYLDRLKVYKQQLTDKQVQNIYQQENTKK